MAAINFEEELRRALKDVVRIADAALGQADMEKVGPNSVKALEDIRHIAQVELQEDD